MSETTPEDVEVDDNILDSIKVMLDIQPDYTEYDTNIKILINSAFSTLQQVGVGPDRGFRIRDNSTKWADLTTDDVILGWVAEYVYHKVKLAFDPPQTSFHISAIKEQLEELVFRINTRQEGKTWVLLTIPLP